jgi:hypothetical protein
MLLVHKTFSPVKGLRSKSASAKSKHRSNKTTPEPSRYKVFFVQDLPTSNLQDQIQLRKHKGEVFSFSEFRRIAYCLIFALEKLEKVGYSLPLLRPSKIHMIDSLLKIDAFQMVENQLKHSTRQALISYILQETRVNSFGKYEKFFSPEIEKLMNENHQPKKAYAKEISFNKSSLYSSGLVLLEFLCY